jgi:adenosyl cobinamide kinase/adenosyl cobinamide phosphate guanylyltransferase
LSFSFLLGGVRSGKSRLAVELAARQPNRVTFIATAEARDGDMTRRIGAHQEERSGLGWATIEAAAAGADTIDGIEPDGFVIFDCVTVWTANHFLADVSPTEVIAAAERLAEALASRPGHGVVVSNEVGMGVHPSSELGRHYRDLRGAVNVRFAARAERSALVVAGKVLRLEDPFSVLG